MYGVLFKTNQEAGFSNKIFWKSVGSVLSFSLATALTTLEKLFVLLGFACSGIIFYIFVEIIESKKAKKDKSSLNSLQEE